MCLVGWLVGSISLCVFVYLYVWFFVVFSLCGCLLLFFVSGLCRLLHFVCLLLFVLRRVLLLFVAVVAVACVVVAVVVCVFCRVFGY